MIYVGGGEGIDEKMVTTRSASYRLRLSVHRGERRRRTCLLHAPMQTSIIDVSPIPIASHR